MSLMTSIINLSLHHPYDGSEETIIGNGKGIPISHVVSFVLSTSSQTTLSNVLCAPSMNNNLISISQLCFDNNIIIEFSNDSFVLKDRLMGTPLFQGHTKNGIL